MILFRKVNVILLKHDLKNPNFVIVIVNSTKARAKNEMKENAHIQVVWSSPVAKSMYGLKHATMRERRRKSKTCRLFNNSGVIVEQLVIVLK